jgi:hypothetical protein
VASNCLGEEARTEGGQKQPHRFPKIRGPQIEEAKTFPGPKGERSYRQGCKVNGLRTVGFVSMDA